MSNVPQAEVNLRRQPEHPLGTRIYYWVDMNKGDVPARIKRFGVIVGACIVGDDVSFTPRYLVRQAISDETFAFRYCTIVRESEIAEVLP